MEEIPLPSAQITAPQLSPPQKRSDGEDGDDLKHCTGWVKVGTGTGQCSVPQGPAVGCPDRNDPLQAALAQFPVLFTQEKNITGGGRDILCS